MEGGEGGSYRLVELQRAVHCSHSLLSAGHVRVANAVHQALQHRSGRWWCLSQCVLGCITGMSPNANHLPFNQYIQSAMFY